MKKKEKSDCSAEWRPASPQALEKKSLHFLLLWGWHYMQWDPFDQLGSDVLAASPPSLLPTPSLLSKGPKWETAKALELYKDCLATAKTSVCYQHCFGHQSRTKHSIGCYEANLASFPPPAKSSSCWISSNQFHASFEYLCPYFCLLSQNYMHKQAELPQDLQLRKLTFLSHLWRLGCSGAGLRYCT